MRPHWVRVVVSQNVMVRFVEYAMNSLCFGKATHEVAPMTVESWPF